MGYYEMMLEIEQERWEKMEKERWEEEYCEALPPRNPIPVSLNPDWLVLPGDEPF